MLKLIEEFGEGSATYSVYENPYPEMIKQIKEYKFPKIKIKNIGVLNDGKECCFEKVQDNGNYMVVFDNGDVASIKPEIYDEHVKDSKLEIINEKFDINKILNEHLCPFVTDYETIYAHNVINGGFFAGSSYDSVKIHFIADWYSTSIYKPSGGYSGNLEFKNHIIYPTTSLYLNLDGNIVNRNYNINFNKESENTKDIVLKRFYDGLEKSLQGQIEKHLENDIYFIEGKYAIMIYSEDTELNVNLIPYQNKNFYYERGDSYNKITKPVSKNLKKVTYDEFKCDVQSHIDRFIVTEEKMKKEIKEFMKK